MEKSLFVCACIHQKFIEHPLSWVRHFVGADKSREVLALKEFM
jgi:hypothetical protein